MKGVQCYEFFGGIALKNHAFSFFFMSTIVKQISFYYIQLPKLISDRTSSCNSEVFDNVADMIYRSATNRTI